MNKENLTRSYILKAFVHLLHVKSYDKISVCDICAKAGVSRMSFYRNFNSKEELVFIGIENITKQIKEHFKGLEVKNQFTFIKIIFETFGNFKNIFHSFESCQISKTLIDLSLEKLESEFPVDSINKTMKYLPVFYFGSLFLIIFKWLKLGAKETPDEMARLVCSLMNTDEIKMC